MSQPAHSSNNSIAIILSAGYFGFFAHAGFMLAVEEMGIDYSAIAGSSAGAIVAALHASGVPAREIVDTLVGLERKSFWDSTGLSGIVRALWRKGRGWTGLLKGEQFESRINHHLRAKTFEECPRSLYVTALNLTKGVEETFHSGTIADKVRASCSYPFLLKTKNIEGNEYWDGGFLSKVSAETLIERERPAQLIIHYLPMRDQGPELIERNWSAIAMMERALSLARKEIEQHRLRALGEMNGKILWVQPEDVPQVSPRDLSAGRLAVDAAYKHAKTILSSCLQGKSNL